MTFAQFYWREESTKFYLLCVKKQSKVYVKWQNEIVRCTVTFPYQIHILYNLSCNESKEIDFIYLGVYFFWGGEEETRYIAICESG